MSLSAGDKLGPYEILASIGAGGMGEVYRARDPRLNRDVAIKVSAERFSERFEREAKVVASLNHPNICHLYDVGPNYLVMELVEGPTLAERIAKGPIPPEEALKIAAQIAEALDAAHEKGITHRDLKPGNIKIRPDGTVKVLDFGLAKVGPASAPAGLEAGPTQSPTLSMAATQAGVILGTAGYMSPEQARGEPVDKRADIWAFGVVLHEMLTGKRVFEGKTVSDTLAAVLMKDPDLTLVPVKARKLVEACLERDPKRRLRDIGEAWRLLLIEEAPPAPVPTGPRLAWLWPAVAGVLLIATAALGYLYFQPAEAPRVLKFSIVAPEKAAFANSTPAVSPDGRKVALSLVTGGQASIWIRDLDALESRLLPGTEGGVNPFWSPDSRFLAFFAGGKLKKIDLAGGPALPLCEALNNALGSWSKDDVILFTPSIAGLSRVSASGGTPVPVTTVDSASEILHVTPWFLPDGRHFLYYAVSTKGRPAVYAGDLDSKTRRLVLEGNTNVVYAPPANGRQGYVLFARDQTLMAQPFDAAKAELSGDPVAVAQPVDHPNTGARFSASENGVLVYATGGAGGLGQLTWFERSGKQAGTVGSPGAIQWPAISPDGAKVAFEQGDPPDIWVHDLARGSESRFTFGPQANMFAQWSADGGHIAFTSLRSQGITIAQRATSGAAQDEILDGDARVKRPVDWSRDGKYILEQGPGNKTGGDIWVLPLAQQDKDQQGKSAPDKEANGKEGGRKPFAYLNTEFGEGFAKLSPNGQWMAYTSDESKRPEVYVQTFPVKGGKWQVSIDGGDRPVWSRDGKELYFISPDQKMMAAEIKGGPNFDRGAPKPLFDVHIAAGNWFDVSKDGRFLMPVPVAQSGAAPVNVVVNWQAALKK
jgi:Tol biopolymer transport system component/predicted Ser/Thr protein kinase